LAAGEPRLPGWQPGNGIRAGIVRLAGCNAGTGLRVGLIDLRDLVDTKAFSGTGGATPSGGSVGAAEHDQVRAQANHFTVEASG
jgi:hypothetical protein